jgi:CheY-like chemotaxis protein
MDASPSSTRPRVLLVDDDRLIRTAYRRQLRGRVDVVTAESADEALAALTTGTPFAAVVSDLCMPGTDGLALLARVRDLWPDTVRVLFTGKADLRTVTQAVNEIGVFRILLKPCPPAQLWECIESAATHFAQHGDRAAAHASDTSEAVSALQALVRVGNPALHARATRLRRLVHHIGVALALPRIERVELAAALCGLGLVAADRGTIDRFAVDRPGDDAERRRFDATWAQAAAVLDRVQALHDVAAMVAAAGGPVPATLSPDPTMLGAQVLRTAVIADGHLAGGRDLDSVLTLMRGELVVPPQLVDGLATLPSLPTRTRLVDCELGRLEPGMVLEDAVRSATGRVLVPPGRPLTSALIQLINGYARTLGVAETLLVKTATIPHTEGDDAPAAALDAAAVAGAGPAH